MLFIDTLMHWFHLMASAIWVGGMFFAGFVLSPVARRDLPPQVRGPFFKAAGKRFGAIGRAALVALIVTGIYKISLVWNSDILASKFGIVMSIKLCLFFAMIALSALHDFVWGPRLARMSGQPDTKEYRSTLFHLSFWSRVNMALVTLIVFLGAYIRINPF